MSDSPATISTAICWYNETDHVVKIKIGNGTPIVVQPNRNSGHVQLQVRDRWFGGRKYVLDLEFTSEDGTSSKAAVNWVDLGDHYALSQQNDGDEERALRLVPKDLGTYSMEIRSPSDGGILIVGTIDTK